MDKNILSQYIDACELIKETEEEIKKLNRKKKTVIQTNVSGSNQVARKMGRRATEESVKKEFQRFFKEN